MIIASWLEETHSLQYSGDRIGVLDVAFDEVRNVYVFDSRHIFDRPDAAREASTRCKHERKQPIMINVAIDQPAASDTSARRYDCLIEDPGQADEDNVLNEGGRFPIVLETEAFFVFLLL